MWDMENHKWRIGSEYVENISIDSSNTLQFGITKYAPYAMLQSRCTDYPYTSWKIRSVGENGERALLDIETKRMKLVFEIGDDYVKLIERDEPELQHLVNKEMSPGYLLHELSRSGIHLLPIDEDHKLAGIQLKTAGAENNAINEIMSSIRSFSFRSCRQNISAPPGSIILKLRENLEYD